MAPPPQPGLPDRWRRPSAGEHSGLGLWVYALTKDRADRLMGLLADCPYLLPHYLGEDGVENIEGNLG